MPSDQSMKSSEEFVMAAKSTCEHLIDVGVGLMHQNGYNATGLTDILKAADVPKGSFYHHFGSKEDLPQLRWRGMGCVRGSMRRC
jgi:hypothetical protein